MTYPSRQFNYSLAVATALLSLQPASSIAATLLTSSPFDVTVGVGSTYNAATDTITGGTVSAPIGFTTVSDLKNNLQQIDAQYSPASAVVIRAGYRGLPLILQSPAGSTTVTLSIPLLGYTNSFAAETSRDGNTTDLFNYLKSSGADLINQMQKKLAEVSPVDPVAGNPNSMQSRMVSDDFDRSFTQFASNIKSNDNTTQSSSLIGVGLTLGSMSAGGLTTTTTTVPLSYTVRNDLDPRKQWTFYAPLSASNTQGAQSYTGNLGLAYRFPVNDEWALSPAFGYGITGSVDLGSAAAMMATSLTSQYTLKLDGYDLAFGNMIGLYQTTPLSAGDYSSNPGLSNTVYRNGVLLSVPTNAFGSKMALETSFILTNYTGSALYSSQYEEIGITLGTNKSANAARSYGRAGATLLSGSGGVSGYRLNFGYWF
jgi:hypothetical protein